MYEELINNAIKAYRKAKRTGDKELIERSVNDMENVHIMVCDKNVKGSNKLSETIEDGYNELMKERM